MPISENMSAYPYRPRLAVFLFAAMIGYLTADAVQARPGGLGGNAEMPSPSSSESTNRFDTRQGADASRPGNAAIIMRARRDFKEIDTDGDGQISQSEWIRRGNFERLDTDRDGYLNFEEMAAIYRTGGKRGRLLSPILPSPTPETDPSYETDRIPMSSLDSETLCGIERERCRMNESAAIKLGLIATGLGPRFPDVADCFGIDDYYALDYSYKRSKAIHHGGMDLPAPWDTPVLAVAAGTVVGRYLGSDTQRGVELVIRHSPEDTGLPFWIYTQYTHLSVLPTQLPGHRVLMGEVIGLTGNTGLDSKGGQSAHRRPALHFVAWFSPVRQFADTGSAIIPVQGQWMDPHAMYRGKPPFESAKLRELAEDDKWVVVPVMMRNGNTLPSGTKLVWPYACTKRQ